MDESFAADPSFKLVWLTYSRVGSWQGDISLTCCLLTSSPTRLPCACHVAGRRAVLGTVGWVSGGRFDLSFGPAHLRMCDKAYGLTRSLGQLHCGVSTFRCSASRVDVAQRRGRPYFVTTQMRVQPVV